MSRPLLGTISEHFAGGWQELFPNGDACAYKGVERPFHGDASTQPWTATVLADTPREARVRLAGRLFRSPFQIEPTMVALDGASALTLNERVTNEGAEPLAAMRSYHPCLGAPCLGPDCLLDSGTRTV